MTNNPTIDGVSRDTLTIAFRLVTRELETLANGSAIQRHKAALSEIRALLDAPAVERQEPVTLAGLLEKNTIVVKVDVYDAQQSTIAQLQARIQALESGRGEPFGYVDQPYAKWLENKTSGWAAIWATDGTDNPSRGKPSVALFTAPPAPVAVVLPDREAFEQLIIKRDGAIRVSVIGDARSYNEPVERDYAIWRACLDATAALNTPK